MPKTRIPSLFLLLAPLAAQHPSATQSPDAARLGAAIAVTAHPFLAPIHTMADDERFGPYGIWATGDAYKVSFHDGYSFYPLLGRDYDENLPVTWHTASVTIDGKPLVEAEEFTRFQGEWRYEYRYGAVVEAYDVATYGVEQTFVIGAAPDRTGDLVIEGVVTTRLYSGPVAAAHQALEFRDDRGRVRVTYGAATAIDADGRRQAVDTAFDGQRITLTVPASWLARATFPVTVDPLTQSSVYSTSTNAPPQWVSMHKEDESATNNQMVVYSRQFTNGDADLYARLGSPDLSSSTTIYVDAAPSLSTAMGDATFVGGADRWVLAFWRHNASEDRLRFYYHDKGNVQFNSGLLDSSYNPPGEHVSFPAIGGNAHPTGGFEAVAVYRMDTIWGNSGSSEIHAVRIDAQRRAQVGRIVVENGLDAEAPDINCQRGWFDDGYVVTYQARSNAIDDYDIYARRILLDPQFTVTQRVLVGPDNLGDKVRPVVQGWDDRFLVAMLQDVTPEVNGVHFGRNVLTVRLDWPNNTSVPTQRPHRVAGTSTMQDITHLALAFDGITRSNWCLLYDADSSTNSTTVVKRLGSSGTQLEVGNIGPVRYHGATVFDVATQRFAIVSCSNDQLSTIYAQQLEHANTAWNAPYGASCGGGVIGSDTTPYPGILDYRVLLTGAPPGQPAALLVSFSSGFVDLATFGAANCAYNLGQLAVSLPLLTDASGRCTVTMPLPDSPLFLGDLYWQYVYQWPAAPTPLTIGTTRGMRASVR